LNPSLSSIGLLPSTGLGCIALSAYSVLALLGSAYVEYEVRLAGKGMCSGGWILDYLKAMLGDLRREVLLVGYQAKGMPGAVIQASRVVEGVG